MSNRDDESKARSHPFTLVTLAEIPHGRLDTAFGGTRLIRR
jgi:hypothetical protein